MKFINLCVFELFDHKVAPFLGNLYSHGNHFVPHWLRGGSDVITQVWIWEEHPVLS